MANKINLKFEDLVDPLRLEKTVLMGIEKVYTSELVKKTPRKTGFHADAWETISLGGFNYVIVNPYGDVITFLEEGTKAHFIKPKNKKMLKFRIDEPPKLRNTKEQKQFSKHGVIFFYNRQGPVLGFERKGSRYYCYAKEVKHPGFEGRWFIKNTMEDPKLFEEFKKFISDRIDKIEAR